MSCNRRPRRAHSLARNSPTGPAPTIRTSVSVSALRILSRASDDIPLSPFRPSGLHDLNRMEANFLESLGRACPLVLKRLFVLPNGGQPDASSNGKCPVERGEFRLPHLRRAERR